MAHRYDKYDPISGGFRAPLAEAWPDDIATPTTRHVGVARGVCLNGSGQLVVTGAEHVGVLVVDGPKPAGAIVDVMTDGEIADFDDYVGGDADPAAPGEYVSAAAATGILSAATIGGREVGFVVATNNRNRLIVRVGGVVA